MASADPHGLRPLWEQSMNGDEQAWNALLGKLRPYLQALIRSWLGPDLARQLGDSDLVQDVLLRVTKGRQTLRAQSVPELLGWARSIAYRVACDRKAGGRPCEGAEELEQVPASDPGPLEALAGEEDALHLAAALEQLSQRRREVVLLRLIDGLSFDEISQRLEVSSGALRVLFYRAIEELRRKLETDT